MTNLSDDIDCPENDQIMDSCEHPAKFEFKPSAPVPSWLAIILLFLVPFLLSIATWLLSNLSGDAWFRVAQVWLPMTGLPAIYYTSKKNKLAPLFGLLGQPAWFYCAIYTKQWGMFALNVAYCLMWVLTAYRWWKVAKKT